MKLSVVSKSLQLQLSPLSKFKPFKSFKLSKTSKAAVALDNAGCPQLFVFNTHALLDLLSEIDDALVDKLPSKEYHSKNSNPAGWLIDELESKMPLKENFIASLKAAIKDAKENGWASLASLKVS